MCSPSRISFRGYTCVGLLLLGCADAAGPRETVGGAPSSEGGRSSSTGGMSGGLGFVTPSFGDHGSLSTGASTGASTGGAIVALIRFGSEWRQHDHGGWHFD
ncbi:MAG: hypothetical protein QM784_07270 [Polyangiaceae bacterium]